MQFEHPAPLRQTESLPASVPFQHMRAFVESGSLGGVPFTGSRSPSLGASALSFERAKKMAAVVIAFATTGTMTSDPALASSLALTEIEIPGVPESITSADDRAAETRSLAAIMGALEEEPIEDGYTHHAERAVDAHIEQFGSARLVTAVSASASPARAAALLRLLGRSAKIGAEERRALVRWGLSSQSSEVRDAAVQAVENWEDRSLVALLRGHHERVPWLADYAANVVHDLEE